MRRRLLGGVLVASVIAALGVSAHVVAAQIEHRSMRFATMVAAGAQRLFEAGDREAARDALEQALEMAPGSAVVRRELGMELAASGEWEEAVRHLRIVVEMSPGDAGAARTLAEALEQTGDMVGAIEQLHRACLLEREHGMHWIALAALLLRADDGESALPAAQRAVGLARGVPEAHVVLAHARWRSGDLVGAEGAFADALALDPSSAPARQGLRALRSRRPPPPRVPSTSRESARPISKRLESVE